MSYQPTRLTQSTLAAAVVCAAALLGAPAAAHHSFAMFDLSQHQVIDGSVTAWNYNNPHSWLHVEARDENGEMQTWSFEGASPVHAARQGVNGRTFTKGEKVRIVMSPLRDGRRAGAMCFVVKEDGSFARPNDGSCNSEQVIAQWQRNGWVESSEHLHTRSAKVE